MTNDEGREYRCAECGKLMFKGELCSPESHIDVKCKRCGKLNVFSGPKGAQTPKSPAVKEAHEAH